MCVQPDRSIHSLVHSFIHSSITARLCTLQLAASHGHFTSHCSQLTQSLSLTVHCDDSNVVTLNSARRCAPSGDLRHRHTVPCIAATCVLFVNRVVRCHLSCPVLSCLAQRTPPSRIRSDDCLTCPEIHM